LKNKIVGGLIKQKQIEVNRNLQKKKKIDKELRSKCSWAEVVHACNPSYSGGRDHEDLDTKPAQANNW
jgi:hypothetical protein